MQIKPGIDAKGYRTAVRDYTEPTVVEELGANSYDADASTFLVLLDSQNFRLLAIDDGHGFQQDDFAGLATLGSGNKRGIPFSKGKRHYLGSYGYGIKSTLNIASSLTITSFNGKESHSATIEWDRLEEFLNDPSKGFQAETRQARKGVRGTQITLELKNPTDRTHLQKFATTLANLPDDGGKFSCFVGMYDDVSTQLPKSDPQIFSSLKTLCKKWQRAGKIQRVETTKLADLASCKVEEKIDKYDSTVSAKFYFAGLNGDKVKPLKPGLRGVYVRIHGRLLKQSFTDRKYTYPISKWTKFESGLRVELSIDWLRDQITLSREGIRFENEKLESDFKQVLTRMVSGFIQPHLKRLEGKKQKHLAGKAKQRQELSNKRKQKTKDVTIPGLKEGFIFRPETDAELALVLAQPTVMRKVLKDHRLIDYNDQAPFDCVLHDERRDELVNCELEPRLPVFLEHKDARDVELIIVWTKAGWRIGAKKKGRSGLLALQATADEGRGHYKLLEFASTRSTKPRKAYRVIVLEEILLTTDRK